VYCVCLVLSRLRWANTRHRLVHFGPLIKLKQTFLLIDNKIKYFNYTLIFLSNKENITFKNKYFNQQTFLFVQYYVI